MSTSKHVTYKELREFVQARKNEGASISEVRYEVERLLNEDYVSLFEIAALWRR